MSAPALHYSVKICIIIFCFPVINASPTTDWNFSSNTYLKTLCQKLDVDLPKTSDDCESLCDVIAFRYHPGTIVEARKSLLENAWGSKDPQNEHEWKLFFKRMGHVYGEIEPLLNYLNLKRIPFDEISWTVVKIWLPRLETAYFVANNLDNTDIDSVIGRPQENENDYKQAFFTLSRIFKNLSEYKIFFSYSKTDIQQLLSATGFTDIPGDEEAWNNLKKNQPGWETACFISRNENACDKIREIFKRELQEEVKYKEAFCDLAVSYKTISKWKPFFSYSKTDIQQLLGATGIEDIPSNEETWKLLKKSLRGFETACFMSSNENVCGIIRLIFKRDLQEEVKYKEAFCDLAVYYKEISQWKRFWKYNKADLQQFLRATGLTQIPSDEGSWKSLQNWLPRFKTACSLTQNMGIYKEIDSIIHRKYIEKNDYLEAFCRAACFYKKLPNDKFRTILSYSVKDGEDLVHKLAEEFIEVCQVCRRLIISARLKKGMEMIDYLYYYGEQTLNDAKTIHEVFKQNEETRKTILNTCADTISGLAQQSVQKNASIDSVQFKTNWYEECWDTVGILIPNPQHPQPKLSSNKHRSFNDAFVELCLAKDADTALEIFENDKEIWRTYPHFKNLQRAEIEKFCYATPDWLRSEALVVSSKQKVVDFAVDVYRNELFTNNERYAKCMWVLYFLEFSNIETLNEELKTIYNSSNDFFHRDRFCSALHIMYQMLSDVDMYLNIPKTCEPNERDIELYLQQLMNKNPETVDFARLMFKHVYSGIAFDGS